MILKKILEESIDLSQKISKYDAFDEGTMNHFNIALREVKRFIYNDSLPPNIVSEIEKILIIHPEDIIKEIGSVSFLDRLTINKFIGPKYRFEFIFTKRDIQKRAYVFKNYLQLEKIMRLIK